MTHMSLVARIQRLKRLDLVDSVEVLSGTSFKRSAKSAYPDGDDVCPCGRHRHNFRIDQEEERIWCRSPGCQASGDLVDFTKAYLKLSLHQAVRHLENLFEAELSDISPEAGERTAVFRKAAARVTPSVASVVPEPVGILNPTEEDFRFLEGCQQVFRMGLNVSATAKTYLYETRRHSVAVVDEVGIGYAHQNLSYTLRAKFDSTARDRMKRCGLLNDDGNDIVSAGMVTFPIRNREGRICGFRFKDPAKRYMAQQLRKGMLGGVLFFGEHTLNELSHGSKVLVCEGEHDWVSLKDHGWGGGLLATCGAITRLQLQWLADNADQYTLLTAFDDDNGGHGYRHQVAEAVGNGRVTQYIPPGFMDDPDSYLRNGGSLQGLFEGGAV